MAKKDERTFHFDVPADRLLAVMVDPEFQQAREKAQGALEVTVKEIEKTGERQVFEVHTVEYAKGLTGVDRSKTEKNMTRYDWDLRQMLGRWTHTSAQGERVKVWGSCRVLPDGEKSKLVNEFNLDIKIPLVGGQIEKLVMKELAKGWERYQNVIREFCSKQG